MSASMASSVKTHILAWLDEFVVGLDLCPFARPLLGGEALRVAVCEETDPVLLQHFFLRELDLLQSSGEEEIATSLLVFPGALADFDDYLVFLQQGEDLLRECGLEGLVQLASFHPDYRFAGEEADAASHFSNRAPYPVIHLLREEMLSRVLADGVDPAEIPDRNIKTLEQIGVEELQRRWDRLFEI